MDGIYPYDSMREVRKMEAIEKTKIVKDEMIMELLELLKKNDMKKEANDSFEICAYVDSLEKKLDSMTEELANVKQQLKDMQEDTVLNNLKVQVHAAAERLQERCNVMKEQLFVVKDNIKSKATEIVVEAKNKGKAVLNKISEIFNLREKLVGIQSHVKESQKEVSSTILKIDAFGAGMREANRKIANTIRTFADKEEVDYSQKEKKFSKTDMIKIPWIAKKKILEAMELIVDGAIDKTENLARDVGTYDILRRKAHVEQETVMVSEPGFQYGADVFESYEQTKGSSEKVPEVKFPESKKDGKSR